MKNSVFLAIASIALSGCIGSVPDAPKYWTVEFVPAAVDTAQRNASRPTVKLSSISVSAPYSGSSIAVMRKDGSVAFDAYNAFAAPPVALLSNAAYEAVEASGVFSSVIRSQSIASSPLALELSVVRLALDCRGDAARKATVVVRATVVESRAVKSSAVGHGEADASDGDYSKAFSEAFSRAVCEAAKRLALE